MITCYFIYVYLSEVNRVTVFITEVYLCFIPDVVFVVSGLCYFVMTVYILFISKTVVMYLSSAPERSINIKSQCYLVSCSMQFCFTTLTV